MSGAARSKPALVWLGRLAWAAALVWSPSAGADTLAQALDLAVAADQRLAASGHQVDAANASVMAARALALPRVGVEGLYTRLSQQPAMVVDLRPLPRTELPFAEQSSGAYRIGATLPLYTGGRIAYAVEAAEQGVAAAQQDAVRTVQDVRLAAAEAYANVLRALRLLAVAQSSVQTLTLHERDVDQLHRQGLVAQNDVLAVRAALANAAQDAIRVDNALALARAAYNRQLGRALDAEVVLDEVSVLDAPDALAPATERALAQRAELAALDHQVQALRRQADAARAAERPQLALSAGYNHLQDRYLARDSAWNVTLGASWSLFDGGLARHQASALLAKAEAAADLQRDARSQIALQVRQAWLAVGESRSRIAAAQTAVAQADENLRVARDRYQAGVGTNTEVLDADTLRVRSQSNHHSAVYDNVVAVMRLRRSVGEL